MILSLFVLSIFALIGLQLYQGSLMQKCVLLPENYTKDTFNQLPKDKQRAYASNNSKIIILFHSFEIKSSFQFASVIPLFVAAIDVILVSAGIAAIVCYCRINFALFLLFINCLQTPLTRLCHIFSTASLICFRMIAVSDRSMMTSLVLSPEILRQ